ncbi:uncharacterized protein B0P05DRAFT_549395 [Gilbertella persicaria]|uniref:Tubulin-specific chaperone A n=1 Tax=Rhizopus stolonifer TaxID=4846 RepID=A0A367KUX5_RHIST|nr:uncharacterized protein B0P05DRAFT_549395 [Gilbertella persicaria]KAI8072226.1 hypothetical protein B0P05DRAFT_549395 [Gilbertella persicaria]RCI05999.1 hypothetical protein CU098_012711 [Rhizopus stolonifer]
MNKFVNLSLFTSKTLTRRVCAQCHVRLLSTMDSQAQMEATMNKIEDLFSAAKDELEYAEESQGTTYYEEDRSTAKKAVEDVLQAYDQFLQDLPTQDMKTEVNTKVGMKIKELKMTFEALPEVGH